MPQVINRCNVITQQEAKLLLW